MLKTVKDLLLALINATLILIALCLILGLMIVNRANDITETFATNLIKLEPLKDEVVAARTDIAALRSEFEELRETNGDLSTAAMEQIGTRMDGLSARLDTMQATVAEVKSMPYDLTDHAIDKAAAEFGAVLGKVVPTPVPE